MIIIDQTKKTQLDNQRRIAELKQLLADSDFRMTTDYFSQMSLLDQNEWTTNRANWRAELRGLENG